MQGQPPRPGAAAAGDAPQAAIGGPDQVLTAVAHAATRFLRGERWDDEIDDVLAALGEATGVDRVYLFTVRGSGAGTLSFQLSEWVTQGVESQLELFQGFDMAAGGFARWLDVLPRGESISGRCLDLPASERAALIELGIEAIAVVPVAVGGRWWGWLAFEQTTRARAWTRAELDGLEAAANVLGGSIERQELTDRLRANEARAEDGYRREREASERLRELDRIKDTFLMAVSHELRTPLTAIRGFGSTLLDHHHELDDEQQTHMLERMGANVERLDRLLGDLLDLNRLSDGLIEARPTEVDVPALLAAAVARTPELIDGQVTIRTDVQRARLDPGLAERILDNLLRNAQGHTPPGTPIEVSASATPQGLVLVVEDRGPGIAAADRTSVFDAFRHGPTAPLHAPGAGIGLSLVARFAALHGGRAWAEERDGGGARMVVRLGEFPVAAGNTPR